MFSIEVASANSGPGRLQTSPVPTPGRVVYIDSVVFGIETARTHPKLDRLRLQYRV